MMGDLHAASDEGFAQLFVVLQKLQPGSRPSRSDGENLRVF